MDEEGLRAARQPSDRERLCSRCDPIRATRPHRDKYAGDVPTQAVNIGKP